MPYQPVCVFFFLTFIILQNKFYIESKLNRDLREELMKLFADHVAEKHVGALIRECEFECSCLECQKCPFEISIFDCFFFLFVCFPPPSALLIRANSMPFHVQPSTMAGVVKGLYSLRPGKLESYLPVVLCRMLRFFFLNLDAFLQSGPG